MTQLLLDMSGRWGADICERGNFKIIVIVDLGPARASNLSSKDRGDRITGVPLSPILRTPNKATPGVREARNLDPN